jgi:hypothetical protein
VFTPHLPELDVQRQRLDAAALLADLHRDRHVIASRWVSKPPAFAGKMQPRRPNNWPCWLTWQTPSAALGSFT